MPFSSSRHSWQIFFYSILDTFRIHCAYGPNTLTQSSKRNEERERKKPLVKWINHTTRDSNEWSGRIMEMISFTEVKKKTTERLLEPIKRHFYAKEGVNQRRFLCEIWWLFLTIMFIFEIFDWRNWSLSHWHVVQWLPLCRLISNLWQF